MVKRIRKKVDSAPHPTRVALLDVTKRLISEHGADGFTVEMVLAESGISRGSLYHHFEDFPDLVECALIELNDSYVEGSMEISRRAIEAAKTREEFLAAVTRAARELHSESRFKIRIDRIRMLALCADSESFRERYGEAQSRLIESFAELIRMAQSRGWVRSDIDPKVMSTFMSAYTLGVTLNDVAADPVSLDDWSRLVTDVIDRYTA